MPVFEQLNDQLLVNSIESLTPHQIDLDLNFFKIMKDHDPKTTTLACNLGGLFPSPIWNLKEENLLSVLSFYIVVLGQVYIAQSCLLLPVFTIYSGIYRRPAHLFFVIFSFQSYYGLGAVWILLRICPMVPPPSNSFDQIS